MRWGWISVNPLANAERPSIPTPDPDPPSAEEAARIINEAWKDPDWGTLVWLAMVTGARRGEMSALRWDRVDLDNAMLTLHRSVGQYGGEIWEKDTKTHQRRRVALDPDTVEILREHRERCESRAALLDLTIPADGFVFSREPDCTAQMKPNTVTQRYGRLAKRLGIDTHLHALRHYSATELITAGVDPRTVAGRLGHGGGGATTLRVYSAWVSEADQRAALSLVSRMPRPTLNGQSRSTGSSKRPAVTPVMPEDAAPYERLAHALRSEIDSGRLGPGDRLPTFKALAERDGVSFGTAQRAVALL